MIIDIDQDEGVTDATHNRLMREALRATMRDHLSHRMGDHFRENAKTAPGGEYGYTARSPRYQARKRRKLGHTRPNFFTGKLARETRNSQITATAKRARVIIRAGRPLKNQQRLELEAITRTEEQEIAAFAGAHYQEHANNPKNRRRRRRRIEK